MLTPFAACEEEYLANRNLSIMTDSQIDSDTVDNARLRREKRLANAARVGHSSSNTNSEDYILIATEELPVLINNDANWEYVDYHEIVESARSNNGARKYCSPKCGSGWFLKLRRDILKNIRNKIHPLPCTG